MWFLPVARVVAAILNRVRKNNVDIKIFFNNNNNFGIIINYTTTRSIIFDETSLVSTSSSIIIENSFGWGTFRAI